MLHSSVVAASAQAALSGASAIALYRAATSTAARWLAAVLGLIAGYNAAIGLGYALHPEHLLVALTLFQLCLVFAFASSIAFSGFLWIRFRGRAVHPASAATVIAPIAAVFSLGLFDLVERGVPRDWSYDVLVVLLCVAQLASIGIAVAIGRGLSPRAARALRGYLVVTVLALVPIALDVINVMGVPVPAYRVLRNLTAMAVIYAMVAAFLNDNVQVVSLRLRAVAGSLTITLAAVVVAAELVTPPRGTPEAHETTVKLLWLLAGLVVAVPLSVSALYRRNLILPLENLVYAVTRGDAAALSVDVRDEIGILAEAFGQTMKRLARAQEELESRLRDLSARNQDVLELNQELRFQLHARSRDLARVTGPQRPTRRPYNPGDIVGGRYRIMGLLGRGGMGAVYRVARLRDQRELALKLVLQTSHDSALRFQREAEVAIKLAGDHLIGVVDVGVDDGSPFIVMELVLDGALEDRRSVFGDDQLWALRILLHIARGLEVIHAAGVMHRDLKPANVLLTRVHGRQVAKIADFGIAKEQPEQDPGAPPKLTATGAMIGTPDYMAPELALRGFVPTSAVDIFAFGQIAWELLTGSRAFAAPPLYFSLAGVPLPSPAALPRTLDEALRHTLHRTIAEVPLERPTASELICALDSWVGPYCAADTSQG